MRNNDMMTVGELRRQHYQQLEIGTLGTCIVVPEAEFNPVWAVSLEQQGQRCVAYTIGNKPVVAVRMAIGESREISLQIAPGKKIEATASEKKTPLKEMWQKAPQKTVPLPKQERQKPPAKPAFYRPTYSTEEDKYLIELYNQTPALSFSKIDAKFSEKFPKRGGHAGSNRLYRLIEDKNNNLSWRGQGKGHGQQSLPTVKPTPAVCIADDFIVSLWNAGRTYEEIKDAVKAKYAKDKISAEYRLQILQKRGTIAKRAPRKKTYTAPATTDNSVTVDIKPTPGVSVEVTRTGIETKKTIGLHDLPQMEPAENKESMPVEVTIEQRLVKIDENIELLLKAILFAELAEKDSALNSCPEQLQFFRVTPEKGPPISGVVTLTGKTIVDRQTSTEIFDTFALFLKKHVEEHPGKCDISFSAQGGS